MELRNLFKATTVAEATPASAELTTAGDNPNEKSVGQPPFADSSSMDDPKDDRPAESAQSGVQKIEAVTLTWSKKSVFLLLVLIWFLTLVNNMKTSMVYSLTPYATSDFLGHSLLNVITVVSSAMAGAVYIPMAKALDLWGRAEGFALMTLLCLIGIILLAASQNLPTYCAGEVCSSSTLKTNGSAFILTAATT